MADTKERVEHVERDVGEVKRSLDITSTVVATPKELDALAARSRS
jgi:hypothetical protein